MRLTTILLVQVSIVILGFSSIDRSYAYKLIPISAELSPSGKSSRQVFRIENNSNEPIAVELKVYARDMELDGKDVLKDAEDDFVIYPRQAIVMPGKSQAIRLQWIGNPKPDRELAYRFISEQLPVSFSENDSQGGRVSLLVRFIASIYIVPNGARPNILVKQVEPVKLNKNEKYLEITLVNKGNKHSLIKDPILKLKSGKSSVDLGPEQLPQLASQNILSGKTRKFIIPWPQALSSTEKITASLEYRK